MVENQLQRGPGRRRRPGSRWLLFFLVAAFSVACAATATDRPPETATPLPEETATATAVPRPPSASATPAPAPGETALPPTPARSEAPAGPTQEVPMSNPDEPTPAPRNDLPQVEQARADLAARLDLPPDEIEVVAVEMVVWPDAGLGCPQPGMAYVQVPQDGYRIRLRAGGRLYAYHGGGNRGPFLCEQGQKGSGITPRPLPGFDE